jgi:hypothetical protein
MPDYHPPKVWIRKCRVEAYFDMGNTLFAKAIKPLMDELDIKPHLVGDVSLFYRRIDLDRVAGEYVRRSGQSGSHPKEKNPCKTILDCQNVKAARTGKSIKRSGIGDRKLSYEKQREQLTGS